MKINPRNLKAPSQSSYVFSDGSLHSDPGALEHYLAGQYARAPKKSHYSRCYEKANRLQRLAERANKERRRFPEVER